MQMAVFGRFVVMRIRGGRKIAARAVRAVRVRMRVVRVVISVPPTPESYHIVSKMQAPLPSTAGGAARKKIVALVIGGYRLTPR
jgi:hypothetical protein